MNGKGRKRQRSPSRQSDFRGSSDDQSASTSLERTQTQFGTDGRTNRSFSYDERSGNGSDSPSKKKLHHRPLVHYDDDKLTSADKSDGDIPFHNQAPSSKAPAKPTNAAELEPGTSGRNLMTLESEKSKVTHTEDNGNHNRKHNRKSKKSIRSKRSKKRRHSKNKKKDLGDEVETRNINQDRRQGELMNVERSVHTDLSSERKMKGVVNKIVDVTEPADGPGVIRTVANKESGHGKNDAPTVHDAGQKEKKENVIKFRSTSPYSTISSEDTSFFTPKIATEDKTLNLLSFRKRPDASQKDFVANALDVLVSLKANYESQDRFAVPTAEFRLKLQDIGIMFESETGFIEIMKFLSDYFFLEEVDMTIEPKTDIRICEAYTSDVNIKNCDCSKLHMCKFDLVGTCLAGKRCMFSHDENDPHNRKVLWQHCLHKLSPECLRKIMNDVNNRNSTTSPTVCKFYNNEGNCKQHEKCQHLHVCKHLVTDDCKFGPRRCKRDHDFKSKHSEDILYKYGLEMYQYNHEALIPLLKMNMENGVIKTKRIPQSMSWISKARTAIGGPEIARDKTTTAATATTTKEVGFIPLTETGRYFPMDRDKEVGKAIKQEIAIKEEQKGGKSSNDHSNRSIASVGQDMSRPPSWTAEREAKGGKGLRTDIFKTEGGEWKECTGKSPEKHHEKHENKATLVEHISQSNLDLEPTSYDDKNYIDTAANEFLKENATKEPTTRNTDKCTEKNGPLNTTIHTQKKEENMHEQKANYNSLQNDNKALEYDEPTSEMKTDRDNELNVSGIKEVCEKKIMTTKEQVPVITCDNPEQQHTKTAPTKDEEKKDIDLLTKLEVNQGDGDTMILTLQDVKITGKSALDLENKIRLLTSNLLKQVDSMRSKTDANDTKSKTDKGMAVERIDD